MTALNELQVSVIMTGISGHVIKHINIYQLCLLPKDRFIPKTKTIRY